MPRSLGVDGSNALAVTRLCIQEEPDAERANDEGTSAPRRHDQTCAPTDGSARCVRKPTWSSTCCRIGLLGGQCLSLADYVTVTAPTGEAVAAGCC